MNFLSKIATTVIGTRVAAETGKAGLAGVAAGMLATRIMSRSPMGALVIGAAYLGHKLWQKKKQIDTAGPHAVAVADGLVPVEAPKGKKAPPRPTVEQVADAEGVGIGPPTP